MDGNSNGNIGTFEWYHARRVQLMEAQGASADDLDSLKIRGAHISQALNHFRTQRKALGDSGRFTREGLRDELMKLAATTAGAIKRSQDTSVLLQHIKQVEGKLATTSKADPVAELLRFWQKMERRATFERLGLTMIDPVTGAITYDSLKFNSLYKDALARGDELSQEALEEWPWLDTCPIDQALLEQGQQRKLTRQDPVNAKKLQELLAFKQAMETSIHDALLELKEYLPVDDPIARMAGIPEPPEPPDEAA